MTDINWAAHYEHFLEDFKAQKEALQERFPAEFIRTDDIRLDCYSEFDNAVIEVTCSEYDYEKQIILEFFQVVNNIRMSKGNIVLTPEGKGESTMFSLRKHEEQGMKWYNNLLGRKVIILKENEYRDNRIIHEIDSRNIARVNSFYNSVSMVVYVTTFVLIVGLIIKYFS